MQDGGKQAEKEQASRSLERQVWERIPTQWVCEHGEDGLAFLRWAPATKECSLEKGIAYS